MKFKFEFEFNWREKKTHHSAESEAKRREVEIALRGPCKMCGGKITEPYRRKVCGDKCALEWDRMRDHRKKII